MALFIIHDHAKLRLGQINKNNLLAAFVNVVRYNSKWLVINWLINVDPHQSELYDPSTR